MKNIIFSERNLDKNKTHFKPRLACIKLFLTRMGTAVILMVIMSRMLVLINKTYVVGAQEG